MEGTRVPALKRLFTLLLLVISSPLCAQQPSLGGWKNWSEEPGFFLEPNRFSVVKELNDRPLWLEMGFGRAIDRIWGADVGLEGMAWSRLRALTGFRFPVETADYFFGVFATWTDIDIGWKFRISHISSHDVDGKDSVFGGSSSHYSREFVELTRSVAWNGHEQFLWTVGLRAYFHQVTKIEPWVAVPACFTWRFYGSSPTVLDNPPLNSKTYSYYAFVSSGDGPVWWNATGGLRMEREAYQLGTLGLQLYYQYGASWAGTDAGAKRGTINLQMDVRGF